MKFIGLDSGKIHHNLIDVEEWCEPVPDQDCITGAFCQIGDASLAMSQAFYHHRDFSILPFREVH